MLQGASHVIVGVIESHSLESWPNFRVQVPGSTVDSWRAMRRRVRVENVLKGSVAEKQIDIYEVFWIAGATGDWNATHDGQRAVIPLRMEHGYYRVAGDWWRSIFTVTTGPHTQLPLDESHPLWERIALMNWWVDSSPGTHQTSYFNSFYSDPLHKLSLWRTVKLRRGLTRHPSPEIRIPACRELLQLSGFGLDECWDALSTEDRLRLLDGGHNCCKASDVAAWRQQNEVRGAAWRWNVYSDREERRLMTAMNHPRFRREFCRLYSLEYPGDNETGCPADQPLPSTIVTAAGDVPLVGAWPRN